MSVIDKMKSAVGLVHSRTSTYRKASVAERQAAQSSKTAEELRTMGRTLIVVGLIGVIAEAYASTEDIPFVSHSFVIALTGALSWLSGMIMTGRYVQQAKPQSAQANFVPGSSKLKRSSRRGRQKRS